MMNNRDFTLSIGVTEAPMLCVVPYANWDNVKALRTLGFTSGASGKESTCQVDAGDVRDVGSIPGSGRSPEEEMVPYSSILTRRISWTEEPGKLESLGSQRVQPNWASEDIMRLSYLIWSAINYTGLLASLAGLYSCSSGSQRAML